MSLWGRRVDGWLNRLAGQRPDNVAPPRSGSPAAETAPGSGRQPLSTGKSCLVLVGVFLAVVVLFSVLSSRGGGTSGDGSSGQAAGPSKYEQTWPKNYSSTTCDQWSAKMTSSQRFAAAADMLTAARDKGDGGSGLPPDSLVEDFEAGLDNVCPAAPTMSLAEAGASLYLTEPRFAP